MRPSQYQHGWTIQGTMDERSNLECGKILGTDVKNSRCPRTCADSTATCAYSRVTSPRTTCADSTVTSPRATCADSTCSYSRCFTTCANSSVTSPTATYADSPRTYDHSTCICARRSELPMAPVKIPDVLEPVQIPVSQVPQPPMQILPELMNILHVSEPVQIPDVPEPVQITVSPSPTATYADSTCIRNCADSSVTSPTVTCAESPITYAASPRARHFDPLESDRCIRLAHVVRIWTPRTPAASHGTSIFDGNLFSFLDEI
ncbi:hypothetical protein TNCV_3525861 [Trichonephila clavipes]|nr:hypothetical protein TNCV_3525861 [Trichonephila clavipes]